ncbi:MAG: hypothetical protein SFY56_10130 [Bacteroidota bacterium]|nr:hypothetical protein [Bacteroidota bacterium]
MIKNKIPFILSLLFIFKITFAQHQYYKLVTPLITSEFKDTSNKINYRIVDSLNASYTPIVSYVLKFYPNILFGSVKIYFKPSKKIAKIKPTFFSIFKAPQNRTYKLYFSTQTNTTQDSILLKTLTYNSKVGLIAKQVSHLQDMSTTHFFGFIGWYFKHLSRKAINKMEYDAEFKTIEAGLGYQLLSLANENTEKLKIEKWKGTVGYSSYIKQSEGKYMTPETINNFINDMPIYVSNQYK